MVEYAAEKGWKKGDYKKLNLPFENRLLGQPAAVRERMAAAVEDFTFDLLTKVFNATDTAPLAVDAILSAGSFDLGPKGSRLEDPAEWTAEKIKPGQEPSRRKRERRGISPTKAHGGKSAPDISSAWLTIVRSIKEALDFAPSVLYNKTGTIKSK